MLTYYFVVASEHFMTVEEPLAEVLTERVHNYERRNKPIDFWQVNRPQFLDLPQLKALTQNCPRPAIAVVSTDQQFILWLKNRLEYVLTGSLQSEGIPQ
jgi:Protein of unknown function (DUF2488)